jgi:prepilin-type N-terminal cleavage/methylation domain-containing protein
MLMTEKPKAARTRGFTLVEVLVTVFLIGTLAAVVVPTVRGRLREGYSSALILEFDNLAAAISAYRQNVGEYPPQLDYLNALPTGSAAVDLCGNALSTNQKNNYRGPYIARPITADYKFGSSDALVNDALTVVRGGATYSGGPSADFLQVLVDGVDSLTAKDLDTRIDGVTDQNFGTIKWAAQGFLTGIRYQIQIKPGAC